MDSRTKHPNQTNENENMNEFFSWKHTLIERISIYFKNIFLKDKQTYVPVLFGNALLWTVIFFQKYL